MIVNEISLGIENRIPKNIQRKPINSIFIIPEMESHSSYRWTCLLLQSSFFLNEKLQLQERRLRRRRPTTRWKKCNPVRKKKTEL